MVFELRKTSRKKLARILCCRTPKKHRVVGVSERATIRPESLSCFFTAVRVLGPSHICVSATDSCLFRRHTSAACAKLMCVACKPVFVCVCRQQHTCSYRKDDESAKMYIYILHHTNMSIVATHMYKPSFVDPRDALETSSLRKVAREVSASGKLKSVSYFF